MNYGLFDEEELLERFLTFDEAKKALQRYSKDEEVEILEICPDHPEQPREGCAECEAEDDDDEEDEEEGGEDL